MSGEATKACVAGLASLRPVKLRLYDVRTVDLQYALNSVQSTHTRISLALLDVLTIPLADARTTRIGEDKTASAFESTDETVTFDRGSYLF